MHVACHDFDNRLRQSNFSYHSISGCDLKNTSRPLCYLAAPCLCLSYIYLVATPIIFVATFYPHQYRIFGRDRKTGSRPQLIFLAFLLVATLIFFIATIFLTPASISDCDLKIALRPHGCSFSDRFMSQLLKCSCDLNDWP